MTRKSTDKYKFKMVRYFLCLYGIFVSTQRRRQSWRKESRKSLDGRDARLIAWENWSRPGGAPPKVAAGVVC